MRHRLCLSLSAIVLLAPAAWAGSPDGRWDATVEIKDAKIPFRLDLSGDGANFQGSLFNGDQPVTATRSKLEGDSFVLHFDHYLTTIEGSLKDGRIEGSIEGRFDRDKYLSSHPFRATRHATSASQSAANVPKIDGLWEIPYESPKGEKSWRFIVQQNGADVSAAILRVDGDTGTLTGTYRDGGWLLSHFSGSRPLALSVKPAADGTLEVIPNGAYTARTRLTAYRPADARAKGLPEPTDPDKHTTIRNPGEPFKFSFPDLDGRTVANTDEKFRGKVIVAVVTGSWCPNCHDEAQFLVELDRKYRDRGLEIVALFFEEPEQQDDLSRVRAFTKKYGVKYSTLVAGAPIEMWTKVPQANNLNTWPTTFFVGKDGLVKGIHAGFTSPGSGVLHDQLKKDFEAKVEGLLAENLRASR
jgi:thiol-disulfide isomerase/thioredoxin